MKDIHRESCTVKSAVLIKQCYSIFTLKELTQQQIVKDTP